jgi:CBS domain-containing protein
LILVLCKLISWSIALGSGTAGGTLAPLFTIGGGAGVLVGTVVAAVLPSLGIDPRIAGLVGMAAAFTGASRALLASVVFAFEATRQPAGLLPLLAGCTGAYLISLRTMKETVMTERLARRGTPVISEYSADYLARVLVRDRATSPVLTLPATRKVSEVREWLQSAEAPTHQGFPIVGDDGRLLGVLTRRDLIGDTVDGNTTLRSLIHRAPVLVAGSHSLREAADLMVHTKVGRLPVVSEDGQVVGILSRSDVIAAHERRLDEGRRKGEATLWG